MQDAAQDEPKTRRLPVGTLPWQFDRMDVGATLIFEDDGRGPEHRRQLATVVRDMNARDVGEWTLDTGLGHVDAIGAPVFRFYMIRRVR